jgi:hypothetical protein
MIINDYMNTAKGCVLTVATRDVYRSTRKQFWFFGKEITETYESNKESAVYIPDMYYDSECQGLFTIQETPKPKKKAATKKPKAVTAKKRAAKK